MKAGEALADSVSAEISEVLKSDVLKKVLHFSLSSFFFWKALLDCYICLLSFLSFFLGNSIINHPGTVREGQIVILEYF